MVNFEYKSSILQIIQENVFCFVQQDTINECFSSSVFNKVKF